jgi:hypothetical protein
MQKKFDTIQHPFMKENKNAQKTSEREEFPQTETGHL